MTQVTLNNGSVDSAGSLLLKTNGTTTAVTLDTAQNMGLGVTPSAWGTVGNMDFPSSYAVGYNGFSQNAYNSSGGWKYSTTAAASVYQQSAGAHKWFNAASGTAGAAISFTQAMTLDASGNLLVGTTSYSDGSMFYKATNTALNCWRGTTTATDGIFGAFSNIGGTQTVRAYFRSDGGLANYSANNVNLSDENLKKDIVLAGNYLAKICAIPVKNFRYKDQNETEDLTLGVIAQDVLAVAPELVSQEGFGMDEESKQSYLSVYQTDLQYALMKCIQEQQAIIEQLRADVQALKGQA